MGTTLFRVATNRLPVRLTHDINYFNELYKGIPIGVYTNMVYNMIRGIDVKLNIDYLENRREFDKRFPKILSIQDI